eukprot:2133592-Prymnesium_polylepis.1
MEAVSPTPPPSSRRRRVSSRCSSVPTRTPRELHVAARRAAHEMLERAPPEPKDSRRREVSTCAAVRMGRCRSAWRCALRAALRRCRKFARGAAPSCTTSRRATRSG